METLNNKILVALLELAQSDHPANVQVLAEGLGESRAQVADALNTLGLEGLVNLETIRLTFVGLMHATGLRSRMRRAQASSHEAA